MNWKGSWKYLIQFNSLFVPFFLAIVVSIANAQTVSSKQFYKRQLNNPLFTVSYNSFSNDTTDVDYFPKYPDPTSVMFKSMILPGWGQVINDQIWKVPIIYALLGGLTYYSIFLTKRYHDYRAAYYNKNSDSPNDLRFGPTPDYISTNASLGFLKDKRNNLRNRRDLSYIYLALAYGLNVIDAYVFAHLKPFNVSEDLTMNATLHPAMVRQKAPGFTLAIDLY